MSVPEIVVGVSGGVDSSVAALLLARSGHRIDGLFMKNWEEDDAGGACPAEADAADAESVCRALGIPFHARNFAAEYWDGVFESFLAEHRAGRTPNPDVLCNREIKFRTFLEHAHDLGAERIATGHYARSDERDGRWRLLRA
jgi:tRNA-uridine 2-sulfurtransferase